ncbi:MAG: 4-hydroxy-tetrahydrodipicolinate synthase [Kiritimatiellae bacterium]|nr:4-hydroxy-tetrahydrodipicolinate synthase [Kiritimatiellia bacterium]
MFSGTYTAIVTPFKKDGSVDYDALRNLLHLQIEAGIDGIVPAGTTGESPTLAVPEHIRVIETTMEVCRGRVAVIAGTGANSTAEALHLTREAIQLGVDATLQVTPYYNRPSQEGLVRHFTAVADLGLPVVLYNIPGRTGREISVETVARLARHPKIVAIKEAGGSVDRVSAILNLCEITVLSGDDTLTLPMMAVGASGAISVASNLIPGPMRDLTHLALDGGWNEARKIHKKYFALMQELMSLDVNPIPIKAALAFKGLIEEVYRLPLCPMTEAQKERLKRTLVAAGVMSTG